MRILGARIFLSFLAGKLKIFERVWNNFLKKLAHAYFKRPYFSKFFGGKIKIFNMGYLDEHLLNSK